MDALTLFMAWLFFGCRGGTSTALSPELPNGMPGGQPGWPGSPIDYTPPWPQATPGGLPTFPGKGWEFDEPPPPPVQQRARQLVDELWSRGSGAYRVEQTAGRWIAYQAQIVASGRRGVVAYRLKGASSSSSPGAVALRPGVRRAAPRAEQQIPSAPAARTSPPAPAKPQPVSVHVGPAQNIQQSVAPQRVSPVGLPVLVRGAGIKPKPPSDNVKLLQRRLGIDPDGQFGKETDDAVKAYQSSHGLKPDGIVGPKTWASLFGGGRA